MSFCIGVMIMVWITFSLTEVILEWSVSNVSQLFLGRTERYNGQKLKPSHVRWGPATVVLLQGHIISYWIELVHELDAGRGISRRMYDICSWMVISWYANSRESLEGMSVSGKQGCSNHHKQVLVPIIVKREILTRLGYLYTGLHTERARVMRGTRVQWVLWLMALQA